MSTGEWSWERSRNQIALSDEAFQILGTSWLNARLSYRTLLRTVHADDRRATSLFIRNVLAGKRPATHLHRMAFPDGSMRMIRIQVESTQANPLPGRLHGTLQDVTACMPLVNELIEKGDHLRELSAYVEAVREEEKARMATLLHDKLNQLLAALNMKVALLRRRAGEDRDVQTLADGMSELIEDAIDTSRNVANRMRPVILDFGILTALEWLSDDLTCKTDIAIHFVAYGDEPLLSDVASSALYRIVHAWIATIVIDGGASRVDLVVHASNQVFELEISDNRDRLEQVEDARDHSFLIQEMCERARSIGASIQIGYLPDLGNIASIRVPFEFEPIR